MQRVGKSGLINWIYMCVWTIGGLVASYSRSLLGVDGLLPFAVGSIFMTQVYISLGCY